MYKAVFVDIDGTLVDENKNVSFKTMNAIKKAKESGIEVIICSGRPRYSSIAFQELCDASKYLICTNGSEIYDCNTHQVLYKSAIDIEDCKVLYEFIEANDMVIKLGFGISRAVNKSEYIDKNEIVLDEDIETFLSKNDVVQITLSSVDYQKIEEIKAIIQSRPNIKVANEFTWEVNSQKLHSVHCTNANISKGNAMAGLCKFLKIDLKQAVAIGDGINDISMIKMAGLGVAMGNASDEIKQVANMVTSSNEESGVGEVLEMILEECIWENEESIIKKNNRLGGKKWIPNLFIIFPQKFILVKIS